MFIVFSATICQEDSLPSTSYSLITHTDVSISDNYDDFLLAANEEIKIRILHHSNKKTNFNPEMWP